MNNIISIILGVSTLLIGVNNHLLQRQINGLRSSFDMQIEVNSQQTKVIEGLQKNLHMVVQLVTLKADK